MFWIELLLITNGSLEKADLIENITKAFEINAVSWGEGPWALVTTVKAIWVEVELYIKKYLNWGKLKFDGWYPKLNYKTLYHHCHCQWLWLRWQSGHFQCQSFAVRIQSSAIFLISIFTVNCYDDEKKRGPFIILVNAIKMCVLILISP